MDDDVFAMFKAHTQLIGARLRVLNALKEVAESDDVIVEIDRQISDAKVEWLDLIEPLLIRLAN